MGGNGRVAELVAEGIDARLHLRQPQINLVLDDVPAEVKAPAPRGTDDAGMKGGVEPGQFCWCLRGAHRVEVALEIDKRQRVGAAGCEARGTRLQRDPNPEDVDEVVVCQARHTRPATLVKLHHSARLELDQRLAHRCPADSQPLGEHRLREHRAGRKVAGNNRLRQLRTDVMGQIDTAERRERHEKPPWHETSFEVENSTPPRYCRQSTEGGVFGLPSALAVDDSLAVDGSMGDSRDRCLVTRVFHAHR